MPFNPSNVEYNNDFSPVPEGLYNVTIVQLEERQSRNNPNSRYLNVQFEINDGPEQGRKIFGMITTANDNETAVNIGNSTLKKICENSGLDGDLEWGDFEMATINVLVEHEEYNGEMKARIKKYLRNDELAGAPPAAAAASAQTTIGGVQVNRTVTKSTVPPPADLGDDEPPF